MLMNAVHHINQHTPRQHANPCLVLRKYCAPRLYSNVPQRPFCRGLRRSSRCLSGIEFVLVVPTSPAPCPRGLSGATRRSPCYPHGSIMPVDWIYYSVSTGRGGASPRRGGDTAEPMLSAWLCRAHRAVISPACAACPLTGYATLYLQVGRRGPHVVAASTGLKLSFYHGGGCASASVRARTFM